MIVPMKKVAVIMQAKDSELAILSLAGLGVLHVEHVQAPKGKDITALADDAAIVSQAIAILNAIRAEAKIRLEAKRPSEDPVAKARHIVDLYNRAGHLEEYAANLKNRIRQWEDWGDFDPDTVRMLASKGLYIKLFQIPASELGKTSQKVIIKKISASRGLLNCAAISREPIELSFKEVELPKTGLSQMRARLSDDAKIISGIWDELKGCLSYYDRLKDAGKGLAKELEFHEALRGMGSEGGMTYLTGYIPYDEAGSLSEAARSEKWGILITDPKADDNVPTLMRNPKWVSIIAPVFRFLEIVPGYKELDISPLFLLFLSLFFGMIIGDAGYGLLYIVLISLARRKFAGRRIGDARVFFLLYLFSGQAVLWGLLTGTVFGQEWYLNAGLRPLLPVLNDTRFLQAFCFFLGAFHMTLGHSWQALRKLPSITALADAGWVLILWAAFFLARMLILSYALPGVTKWLIIAGVLLVIFCTSPQKNIFKAVARGLGTVALSIMNNFTDVVSYVRLFAVGLAGVAIADTVNALAATFGQDAILVKIFILFLGHSINIVLGPISVLVHGVRLNVLEFSGHAGLSWSGTPYKPLKPIDGTRLTVNANS